MKIIVTIVICLFAVLAMAQDTIKKKSSVGNFEERFYVLKANKNVRQGKYNLIYNDKLIAEGRYNQGKRAGLWDFYTNGILVQEFDYTNNKLTGNFPDKKKIICDIPNVNPGDTTTDVVKLGGYTAGFKLMMAYEGDVDYLKGITSGQVMIDHMLTINEQGKVISWIARVTSDKGVKMNRVPFNNIPDEAAAFFPATVNGKPTAATIIFHEEMNAISGTQGYTTTQIVGVPAGSAPPGSGTTVVRRP